jgi:excisionase family DNA binding protein
MYQASRMPQKPKPPEGGESPLTPGVWVDPSDVAAYFGVEKSTVLRWIKAGYIKALRLGPRILKIHTDEVDRFVEAGGIPKDAHLPESDDEGGD